MAGDPIDPAKLDLGSLDRETLLALVRRVNEEYDSRSQGEFLDELKRALAADSDVQSSVARHGPVVEVAFGTSDWDNGWFFDEHSPTVTFEDGTVESDFHLEGEDHELSSAMANVSQAYQPLGATATYTVNLLTGDADQDDYGEAGLPGDPATTTGVVPVGDRLGWGCAGCGERSGLQWDTEEEARAALTRHQAAEPGLEPSQEEAK